MGTTQSPGAGSANSGQYSPESAETLRFEEEIQSLVAVPPCFDSPPASESSFTALLGLPPNQAVELLHDADPPRPPVSYSAASSAGGDIWRLPLPCSPIFPSNSFLVERASRFSVFASEESPELVAPGSASVDASPKIEPADSGDRTGLQILAQRQRSTGKRKDGGKSKAKCAAKKSRSDEENITGGDDKLSYVHVRARRGQATDSHSLAERARREKINARMKLLQELVPGCNKISGTALVLDEIINHVQSLQRQVEFLSMRLAAVNPSIDFSDLDSILSGECVQLMVSDGRGAVGPEQPAWSAEGTSNGDRQLWHGDVVHQQWERDERSRSHQQNIFIGQPGSPLFTNYGSNGSDFGEYRWVVS